MSENTTTEISKSTAIYGAFAWWTGVDSNHRKRSWQIYSLLPLATREPVRIHIYWSWRWELNLQPADYKSAALPIELRQRIDSAPHGGDAQSISALVP